MQETINCKEKDFLNFVQLSLTSNISFVDKPAISMYSFMQFLLYDFSIL